MTRGVRANHAARRPTSAATGLCVFTSTKRSRRINRYSAQNGAMCASASVRSSARFSGVAGSGLVASTEGRPGSDVADTTPLGNALAGTPGRLPEAIAEYQAALRINPGRAEPHNDLGNALAAIPDRLPDAIAEYQAALRIQPQNAEMHYNLANALVRMPGRLPEAMAEYQAALRIDPDHADAHANLAKALSGMAGRIV